MCAKTQISKRLTAIKVMYDYSLFHVDITPGNEIISLGQYQTDNHSPCGVNPQNAHFKPVRFVIKTSLIS